MAGLYIVRAPLMGSDLGTNPLLIGFAVVLLPVAAWVKFKRGKHLTTRILVGVPELQVDGMGGKLITEGPYAVIRHPRYAEIVLGAIAYVLFATMFYVTLTGCPGFAPGRPAVSIVVEDHLSEIAETVERAKFSPVRIAAGLDLDVVPHRSYIHKYASPLLRVENTLTEKLS